MSGNSFVSSSRAIAAPALCASAAAESYKVLKSEASKLGEAGLRLAARATNTSGRLVSEIRNVTTDANKRLNKQFMVSGLHCTTLRRPNPVSWRDFTNPLRS